MKLLDWRTAQALTLAQLAERVGVTKISLSRYERGERIPAREIMQKIAAVTDGAVQPNDFYSDETESEGGPRHPEPAPPEAFKEAS